MSASDAYVRVICDSCLFEEVEVELPFVYANMSPESGYYDARDKTIRRRLPGGWKAFGEKHMCPLCAEDGEEAA